MAAKKIKYLVNEVRGDKFVRAWVDGRQGYAVQVWLNGTGEGEPDGDWLMPKVFGLETSIAQSVLQTKPAP